MLTATTALTTLTIDMLQHIGRVYIVAITDDGRLLLARHQAAGQPNFWTYLSAGHAHPRVRTSVTASHIMRAYTGLPARDPKLIGYLPKTPQRRAAAVYAVRTAWTERSPRPADLLQPALQAFAMTTAELASMDIRPSYITAILLDRDHADPVTTALALRDLTPHGLGD